MKTVSAMRASMNWSPRLIATGRRRQKRLGLHSTKCRSAKTPKQAISPHRVPGSRVTHVRDAACGISADGRRLLFLRLNPAEPTMTRPDPNSSRSTSQKGSSSAMENVPARLQAARATRSDCRAIYRKLGVDNRHGAVQSARALRVL